MNAEEKTAFIQRIKDLVKKSGAFTSDDVHSVVLILGVLIDARQKLAANASAARYDLAFGVRATEKQRELTAAIEFFERLLCPPESR